jgi:hypothetical protein
MVELGAAEAVVEQQQAAVFERRGERVDPGPGAQADLTALAGG